MPLRIDVTTVGAVPIVVCDECGERIADARDGNYQWLAETEHGALRRHVFFTHKRCCHDFEQGRGGAAAWYAMELVDLLPHLAESLNVDRDEAPGRADRRRGLR